MNVMRMKPHMQSRADITSKINSCLVIGRQTTIRAHWRRNAIASDCHAEIQNVRKCNLMPLIRWEAQVQDLHPSGRRCMRVNIQMICSQSRQRSQLIPRSKADEDMV